MASIRKHGKGFQVRYYTDGIRQHEPFETLEAAEIRKKEIELDQAKGATVEARPNTVKFGELATAVLDHYKVNELRSHDDIEARFRLHIIPYFGNRKAASITPAMINAYIVKRKSKTKEGNAPNSTINRELEAIRRAFNLARQNGAVMHVPHIPRLKEDNVRVGFFTREEVGRLCNCLKKPLDSFVLFGFLTAWRLDEIRNLEWRNVDFARGEIRIDVGRDKNGAGRVFPMTTELRTILESLKTKSLRSPYVFTVYSRWRDKSTNEFRSGWTKVGEFRKQWARACHKAGLPTRVETEKCTIKRGKRKGEQGIRIKRIVALRLFHDLRRSGVRELAKAIGDRRAQVRSGHKTRSVFDRYNIVSDFDLAEDRRLLDAANGANDGASEERKNG